MVLEEADTASEPPFSESLPSSDVDLYAGDNNPTYISSRESSYIAVNEPGPDRVFVDTKDLPRPWGLLGSSRYHPRFPINVQEACRAMSKVIGRPMRQAEADAMAFHFANGYRIQSYGAPVGIGVASFLAYRRMNQFRFPFWTPGKKFNPDAFGPLRAQQARLMWQSLRFSAYWACGFVFGNWLFGSYGMSIVIAGRLRDPRLKEVTDIMVQKTGKNGNLVGAMQGRQPDQPTGSHQGETYEMARQRSSAQDIGRRGRQNQQQDQSQRKQNQRYAQDDDMSPTGGSFAEEYIGMEGADMNVPVGQYESGNQSNSDFSSPEIQRTTFGSDKVKSCPRQTGEELQNRTTDTSTQQSSGRWERLRQQAMSSDQTQKVSNSSPVDRDRSSRSRNTPAASDSFSFSQGDEDRQLAKSEAQREFDARIERERAGEDFDDRRSPRR